jgi:hypothetical protein
VSLLYLEQKAYKCQIICRIILLSLLSQFHAKVFPEYVIPVVLSWLHRPTHNPEYRLSSAKYADMGVHDVLRRCM